MNKANVIACIQAHLEEKAKTIHLQIKELSYSNDVKSSAGDKHETSKSLAQLEQEKLGMILKEIEFNLHLLYKIPLEHHDHVKIGSLFRLDNKLYFIGVAAGAITCKGAVIFCMSAKAPFSIHCMGKRQGDSLIWQGKKIELTDLC